MAWAAVDHLDSLNLTPAGGVVAAPERHQAPPGLDLVVGDHPFPGGGSLAVAEAIGQVAERVGPSDEVWVLLSGGASSLAAGPAGGIPAGDLHRLYRSLLSSGLDIARMNTIRKRFSRWGGGRLAAALHPATVRVFVVSDVIGDDLAAIGSGPCVADPATAADVRRLLEEAHLWERLPRSMKEHLYRVEEDPSRESPKMGDPALDGVTHQIVANNRLAVEAAARKAERMGFAVELFADPLSGEAAQVGKRLAAALLRAGGPKPRCLIAGGETVVKIEAGGTGSGGRCQELALAAARELAQASADNCTLLAAGTDGRDGPTDAAGAIVDGGSWSRMIRAGRDPARDLADHNSYPALDAAGALLRTGLTGTNVMDLVIGIADR
jgi:glycerate 2-kinase